MDLTNNQNIDHIRLQLKDGGPVTQCHKHTHTPKMFLHLQDKYYAVLYNRQTGFLSRKVLTRSTLSLKQANKQTKIICLTLFLQKIKKKSF